MNTSTKGSAVESKSNHSGKENQNEERCPMTLSVHRRKSACRDSDHSISALSYSNTTLEKLKNNLVYNQSVLPM